MDIMGVVQDHPVAVGVGVLALVFLSSLSRGSSSAGDGGAAASLQSQQIATAGNVQIAGINAGVQTAAMQAATARSAITADAWKTGVQTRAAVQAGTNADMVQGLVSSMSFLAAMNDSDNQLQTNMTQSYLGAQVAGQKMKTELAMTESNNAVASNSIERAYQLGTQKEANYFALNSYREEKTFANLTDVLANREAMARIEQGTRVEVLRNQQSAQQTSLLMSMLLGGNGSTAANMGAGVGSVISGVGTGIGSIASALGSLFGGSDSSSSTADLGDFSDLLEWV